MSIGFKGITVSFLTIGFILSGCRQDENVSSRHDPKQGERKQEGDTSSPVNPSSETPDSAVGGSGSGDDLKEQNAVGITGLVDFEVISGNELLSKIGGLNHDRVVVVAFWGPWIDGYRDDLVQLTQLGKAHPIQIVTVLFNDTLPDQGTRDILQDVIRLRAAGEGNAGSFEEFEVFQAGLPTYRAYKNGKLLLPDDTSRRVSLMDVKRALESWSEDPTATAVEQ